jgi:ABC-type microcin C transport system permease subunit YejE
MKFNKDFQLKLRKFKKDKRALISFKILFFLFMITLPAELVCNVRPLLLVVDGKPYLPILFDYNEKDFGGQLPIEPDYKSSGFLRLLKGEKTPSFLPEILEVFEEEDGSDSFSLAADDFEDEFLENPQEDIADNKNIETIFSLTLEDFDEVTPADFSSTIEKNDSEPATKAKRFWMIWPPIRYDYKYIPTSSITGRVALASPAQTFDPETGNHTLSSWKDGHYLGTDDRGRDVLARLIYGFRISMIFGISLAIFGTTLGCLIGGVQGFFGGKVDLIGQRMTEIWGSMPRLYILIILSSFLVPSALILFLILNLTAWMGIAAYIRAEFLKIRNLEYVKSAKALGVGNFAIMRRHILPNALTPVITFFPFEVTAGILALVSLDYLNLGVPSPAPSMGELLAQGKNNLQAIWILLPTFLVLTSTITLLTFIGEGIRNAFDPRKST